MRKLNAAITYSDTTAPTVSSFTSTTADGSYGVGSAINITATMSEAVVAGSGFTVTLGTGASDEVVVLTATSAGTTLSGTYTVSTGDSSADLNVSSFEVASGQSITDIYGNAMTSTSLPSGNNLADNSALVVDAAPPTSTITSVAYNVTTGVLTFTGSNFDGIGAASASTDIKSYLDWTKLSWDINGDNATECEVLLQSSITSAVVTNTSTLIVTLTSAAKSALEATSGFGAAGGTDTIDVTAGFIKDISGNVATTDAKANAAITYSDTTAPTVSSFTSTTADGSYGVGSAINITTMSEAVVAGSSFTVTLGTGASDEVVLTATSAGTTLSGTYTVSTGDSSADLNVSSFEVASGQSITDIYGNAMTSASLPSGNNLADNSALVVDAAPPTSTITSVAYNVTTGVLTFTGSNFDGIGAASASTDIKSYLDWTKLSWDINGDNATSNVSFTQSSITSAVVTNTSTLTVTLTSAAKSALEATSGFGAAGGTDTIDVTAGFIKDISGNVATTDAKANAAITYSDTTAPTVSSFTSTTADGSYGVGSAINITATMSEAAVVAGSSFTVTLGTGASDEVVWTATSAGTTLSGTYTVSTGDSSADLNVSSFEVASGQSITDIYGNAMTSTSLPSGNNLADNSALVVDAAPPTSTITSVAYNVTTGVLTFTGSNFDGIGAASASTDIKSYLDWTKLSWDINGDNATSNVSFTQSSITSAVVTNTSTLIVTLTSAAKSALEATSGFGAAGGTDTIDVTAGFIKDISGNVATTDAKANAAITYGDTTAPTVSSFTSTTADGSYGVGSAINITATMSEAVVAGSSFTVTLGAGASDEVVLTATSAGTTLSGTYTVSTGDSSADLNVSSFEVASGQSITDIYGNAMTSTSLPSGNNLADNSAFLC